MKVYLLIIGFCLTTLFASAYNRAVIGPITNNYKQDTSNICNVVFYYRFDRTYFNLYYMSNSKSLNQLDSLFCDTSSLSTISSINITTTTSPEGKYSYNKALANSRSLSFRRMLFDRYPHLIGVKVTLDSYVDDWLKVKELIKQDFDLPQRATVMEVLDSDINVRAIGWKLKQIGDGEAWQYITKKYLYLLRVSDVKVTYYNKNEIVDTLHHNLEDGQLISTSHIDKIINGAQVLDEDHTSIVVESGDKSKDFLALKTNLLFDAISLLNIEVEIPIKDRWSISGDFIFPWWTFDNGQADSKRNRIQLLNANIEARYWFGNRDDRPVMTGWFGGVYAGGGIYDFERNAKGYQGEFFIMGGLSGGYAHTINKRKNLRMEYSLGVGYMQTDYRYYEAHFSPTNTWHPMYDTGGNYTWIGPTKLKVSLVWMLSKKGRRR